MEKPGLPLLWLGMAFLVLAKADIRLYKLHGDVVEIESAAALFGPPVPTDGLRGLFVLSNPPLACSQVDLPPNSPYNYGNWFLLIQRGICSFEDKVRNAQAAGYQVAVIHNVNSSSIEPMAAGNDTDILIPALMIGSDGAEVIVKEYINHGAYYALISQELPYDVMVHLLLLFSILVGLCFLGMVIFIVVKYIKDRRRRQSLRLPRASLRDMPVHRYQASDLYTTCSICLEDYVAREKIRILPCCHAYHTKCIDPWLTQSSRLCPVCKRRVLVLPTDHENDISSDSDEESRPLLQNSRSTTTQSAFQRARSHFLGLAESVASSSSSSSSSSSGSSGSSYQSATGKQDMRLS